MTSICLCMIVKDEASVIRRCLASVRSILHHWIVVDTGSTDGTQAVVREVMTGLPGIVVERPWIDFAYNRSEALALARPHAAYCLIIDADDELLLPAGFALPPLKADSYEIDITDGGIVYQRTQLVSNAKPWRYRGVLHEFPDCFEATTRASLPITMRRNHDGARRRDPDTYRRDAALLERALAVENDSFLVARYTFYLAQSRRDCGDHAGAVEAYLRRADQGYWSEEAYISLLNAGRLMETLGYPAEAVLATLARASALCPHRAEAAHAASRYCRLQGRNAEGCDVGEPALGLAAPDSGLLLKSGSMPTASATSSRSMLTGPSATVSHSSSRCACSAQKAFLRPSGRGSSPTRASPPSASATLTSHGCRTARRRRLAARSPRGTRGQYRAC